MLIRKERAGSTSLGHTWENDGDTVEVPDEDVPALLAIRDAGFSVVEPAAEPESSADGDGDAAEAGETESESESGDGAEQPDDPNAAPEPVVEPAPAPDQEPVTEPAPAVENPITEAPATDPAAAKPRTPRKPKADA